MAPPRVALSPSPSAILFDLDDTLIERARMLEGYARLLERDFRARLSDTSAAAVLRVLVRADRGGYHLGRRSSDLVAWLRFTRPEPKPDELDRHFDQFWPTLAVAREGAALLLTELRTRGIAVGVVTNGREEMQHEKLRRAGLLGFLDTVVVSESAGFEKPDPNLFRIALAQLGAKAEHTWFVGDHPRNDVLGAASAGLAPVWLRGLHPWPRGEAKPTREIDRLPELLALLEREAEAQTPSERSSARPSG